MDGNSESYPSYNLDLSSPSELERPLSPFILLLDWRIGILYPLLRATALSSLEFFRMPQLLEARLDRTYSMRSQGAWSEQPLKGAQSPSFSSCSTRWPFHASCSTRCLILNGRGHPCDRLALPNSLSERAHFREGSVPPVSRRSGYPKMLSGARQWLFS